MTRRRLIELAVRLGKQAMVLDTIKNCSYHGADKDMEAAAYEYARRVAAFCQAVDELKPTYTEE